MVVRNVFHGGIHKLRPWDDVKRHKSCHNVQLTVSQTTVSLAPVHGRGGLDLLLANTRPTALSKSNQLFLELVVWLSFDEPPLRCEFIRVRKEVLIPVVDHRGHAYGCVPGNYVCGLSVLALVN